MVQEPFSWKRANSKRGENFHSLRPRRVRVCSGKISIDKKPAGGLFARSGKGGRQIPKNFLAVEELGNPIGEGGLSLAHNEKEEKKIWWVQEAPKAKKEKRNIGKGN